MSAIKSLKSGAWTEIDTMKVPVSGAYQGADHANALISGAWQEVWSAIGYTCKTYSGSSSTYGRATLTANGDTVSFTIQGGSTPSGEGYYYFYLYFPEAAFVKGDTMTWSATFKIDSISGASSSYYYGPYGYVIDGSTDPRKELSVGSSTTITRNYTATYAEDEPYIAVEITTVTSITVKGSISNVKINGKKCVFDF